MYIFGIDVPLVEVFIGISIMMLIVFIFMVYVLIRLSMLNRKINKITSAEEEELQQFKKIRRDVEETRKHEEEEVSALKRIKTDIESVIGRKKPAKKRK